MTPEELRNEKGSAPSVEKSRVVRGLLGPAPVNAEGRKYRQSKTYRGGGKVVLVESEEFPNRVEYKVCLPDGTLLGLDDVHPDYFMGALED